MKFCTIADKNYLTKALAMYQSLTENLEQFTLYFLCLDDESGRAAAAGLRHRRARLRQPQRDQVAQRHPY